MKLQVFFSLLFFSLLGVAFQSNFEPLGTGKTRVQVISGTSGRPLAGERITLFKGQPQCDCQDNKCLPAAVTVKTTPEKPSKGIVEFTELEADTEYFVCLGFHCVPQQGCLPNNQCQHNAVACASFKTNKNGNHAMIKLTKP